MYFVNLVIQSLVCKQGFFPSGLYQCTYYCRSGEDVWKAMGIVEVMQKTNQYIPPEVQELVDRQLERQQVART